VAKRRIKKTALSTTRCPYCDSKLDTPLGIGPTSRDMVRLGKELGLRFSEHNLKHFVREGMLPRSVQRPMVMDGKHTSIGVFPEKAAQRLRIIAKMKLIHKMSEEQIKVKLREKGLLYE
jgi:hypothetical protein